MRSRSRSRQAQAGLTFVELIIVFVVLGLLLSITVRAVRGKILVDSSGTPVQLGSQINFSLRYGATLAFSPTPKDDVQFDPRGFAVGVTASAPKFIVALGGRTDTVCVTALGKITTRSCP